MTNADKIRNMTDEELAIMIMCLYDTAGDENEIMPCIKDGMDPEFMPPGSCYKCISKWLKKEVKPEQSGVSKSNDGVNNTWQDRVMQRFTRSE